VSARLLLDENLSPTVALTLRNEGIDACGVRDRGLLEATDPEVFARAFAEERVVVTMNVGDFELLARTCELHAGVVLLECGNLLRHEQLEVVRRVAAAIAERVDMINTVLRVDSDGAFTFEQIPPAI
jgi:predicted nuclease of predicted toxin-antitoxin system